MTSITSGILEAIYIASEKTAACVAIEQATVIAGHGLFGDRYVSNKGSFSKSTDPDDAGRNVTLIEAEAIDAALAEHEVDCRDGLHRRNLVTRGLVMDACHRGFLVIGDRERGVVLRVERVCPPCGHLLKFVPRSMTALKGRGGLRTTVLRGGEIRVGDPIVCITRDDARQLIGDV